jgi:glycerol-3-phosphate dehydrogenase (NAD(P)+)
MKIEKFKHLGVMGGGAWGTALAQVLTLSGHSVKLQVREPEVALSINTQHRNHKFLPDVALSPAISASDEFAFLAGCDLILAVPPAQFMRASLEALRPHVAEDQAIILCAKGVERGTDMLMHMVLKDVMPKARAAVLAGPNFAIEVAQGLPTAVTLACEDEALGQAMAQTLSGPTLRPYYNSDLIAAEAGGAIKNVLAIACGIVHGRGMGRNAQAALITRGFAELVRFAVALGGQASSMVGMCGLGDLVLTCSSPQSRNMSLGIALGEGKSLDQALMGKLSVAEGVQSAPAIVHLAKSLEVDLPICKAVAAILAGTIKVDTAIENLYNRPLKSELSAL